MLFALKTREEKDAIKYMKDILNGNISQEESDRLQREAQEDIEKISQAFKHADKYGEPHEENMYAVRYIHVPFLGLLFFKVEQLPVERKPIDRCVQDLETFDFVLKPESELSLWDRFVLWMQGKLG